MSAKWTKGWPGVCKKKTKIRSFSIDSETDKVLVRLVAGGEVSPYLRSLIWRDAGRRELLDELRGRAGITEEEGNAKSASD